MFDSLFIMTLGENPVYFFAVVLVVVLSIILHELAHGYAAIYRGDDTPIRSGHMTGNPLVHMGPWSLIALALFGIAWGQMPIDSTRIRGKYGEAIVAFAGPATNLLLAFGCMIGVVLMEMYGPPIQPGVDTPASTTLLLLEVGGLLNLVLFLFNLIPVPPLDGSHILANFNRDYDRFIHDPSKQGVMMLGWLAMFAMIPLIFNWSFAIYRLVTSTMTDLLPA